MEEALATYHGSLDFRMVVTTSMHNVYEKKATKQCAVYPKGGLKPKTKKYSAVFLFSMHIENPCGPAVSIH
jgi:hypothetical protein